MTFNSRLGRGTKNGVFSNWESFKFLEERYQQLISAHYSKNCLILESQNSQENLSNLAQQTLSFVKSGRRGVAASVFNRFTNESRDFRSNIDLMKEYKRYEKSISRCQQLIKAAKKND